MLLELVRLAWAQRPAWAVVGMYFLGPWRRGNFHEKRGSAYAVDSSTCCGVSQQGEGLCPGAAQVVKTTIKRSGHSGGMRCTQILSMTLNWLINFGIAAVSNVQPPG